MAEKIKSMNVDILVDLAGHSANSGLSLFAYRVAPVQISGLGWMETTGFSAVDYLITDEYLDPTGNTYITERPLYLKSQFCYKCHRDVVASSGAPCIKNGYITQTSHTENIPYALINQLELNVESHSRTLLCTQTTHPKSGQIVQESFQERFDQQDF